MNNATDGDILVAWALTEAAEFWAELSYRVAARRIATEVGRKTIIFPTLCNLMKLARSNSVAEAIERARREPLVTVLPTVHRTDAGKVLRIPPEAGYELTEVPLNEGR